MNVKHVIDEDIMCSSHNYNPSIFNLVTCIPMELIGNLTLGSQRLKNGLELRQNIFNKIIFFSIKYFIKKNF